MSIRSLDHQVALVTGSARRLGAAIARRLHGAGMRVALHYRASKAEAEQLAADLNAARSGSASVHGADLLEHATYAHLVDEVVASHGALDVLVNNASSFYPTSLGETSDTEWNDLLGSNLKAPYFLSQAAAPWLRASGGCIVNMADVYGMRPRTGYAVYCIAKAGLIMLTEALAKELAPEVRVNAIAPGAVLPPSGESAHAIDTAPEFTPLERWGNEREIADAALFLVRDATFTSGSVLPVDGARRVFGYE